MSVLHSPPGLGHRRDTAYTRKQFTQPSLPREEQQVQKLPERADSKDEISSQCHTSGFSLMDKDI